MTTVTDIRPLLIVLIGLIAPILIYLAGEKRRDLREGVTFITSIIIFLLVASMAPHIYGGGEYILETPELISGISISFLVDPLSMFFALLASLLWIVTSMFSVGYMRGLNEHKQTRYYAAFAISIAATMGIATSKNLFTLFIFYEILTIATYPLVIHEETKEAMKAGWKYLGYTLTAGAVFLLLALIITYDISGTLTFAENGFLTQDMASTQMLQLLFIIFIIGFGVKAAIMPLHGWLPSAMIAPTPVSALLHCVAVVKSGTFGVIRVVNNVFGIELTAAIGMGIALATIASITIILSMLVALKKDKLKAKLAYSTINELSYIVLGAALLSYFGIAGSIIHISNHAFMKIGMFFFAGAVFVATGKEYVSEMDGIGWRMPIHTLVFSIGALSLAGIPPLVGFVSKWYLIKGAIQAELYIFVLVLIASAILNILVFWPIIYKAFFKKPEVKVKAPVPKWITAPMLFAMAGTIILGLFALLPYSFLELAFIAADLYLP
ncbi:proton-conducting transporter membrane subunit [Methanonatronarchaeum sp. AMET-Sl]|uniref:proton-conducting transporter transmembrane domain-containing protein n=1 Tax=Methanonatronarchaeum sp. AMET-Sl TaxID=3037654 RepID=UPI00244DBC55|nr:proton-conducting transporter membrane subunit [Methanonatronarchaeum sp. AMET-Sl]WGI17496.1 proton-conducting transporter membrane subunit [Methanonatronarchaeum sp. AMET-Sl]